LAARSAGLWPAVSQVFDLPGQLRFLIIGPGLTAADYKSAIRQARGLRYEGALVRDVAESSHCASAVPDYLPAMDWQQVASLLIVAAAAVPTRGATLRRRRFQFGRDTHCGCTSPAQHAPKSSIVFHARKGEKPTVHVKMK
jgi:hypothetical protein